MEHVNYENAMCKESLDHAQGKVGMILELLLDNMTTNFSDQVVMGEQIKNKLEVGKMYNATVGILPVYPQEQYLLPNQRPAQGNQKQKQKQINKGNNDQGRRCTHFDPSSMYYTHLLPILILAREIMHKEIKPSRFPYNPRHDPNAIFGYHARYIGHSTEACIIFKNKV